MSMITAIGRVKIFTHPQPSAHSGLTKEQYPCQMSGFNGGNEELTNRLLSPTVHKRLYVFPINFNRYAVFINFHRARGEDVRLTKA